MSLTLPDHPDLPDRLLPLTGAFNARDVGGYDTPTGPIAWGRLFRTAGLDLLDDADRAVLAERGVRTVLDLRRDDERLERPSALDGLDVALLHVSVTSGAPADFTEMPDLATVYGDMVATSGPALAAAVSVLAEPGALPAIVHCTAGKDRTGVVVALVLSLAGVDDDVVVADYAVSAGLLGEAFAERLTGADPQLVESLAPLLGSPPELIRTVLSNIRATYGDVEAFLVQHGMAPDVPDRLRRALLAP